MEMKIIALCLTFSILELVHSKPVINRDPNGTQILRYEVDNMPNSYKFYYDTNDGSSRMEEGKIQDLGTDQAALDVLGTVRWYDEKGTLYQMTYKAGKRGYRTVIKKLN